ncbi:MAG TPA: ethanolamine ammonia-lyase subunit EutC [Acetobacteraceae bacterium]|nr:ethanolamine ammonia-lyase subunit EutC [Acetobacteraceae bacterium]
MERPPAAWTSLRRFTPARVAIGRVGNGLPTGAHLAFQAAHAAARDAVHAALDIDALRAALGETGLESIPVRSLCAGRDEYLLRPDRGRRLHPEARPGLTAAARPGAIVFAVCDGLSATAVQAHAAPLLSLVAPALARDGVAVAPIVVATQGRVALGDEIGEALAAEAVVVLIGERPGLSAPDSLGAYLSWQPRRGRTDAERNCISNIRPEGLPIPQASAKLLWLIREMRRLRLSGVGLKDEHGAAAIAG